MLLNKNNRRIIFNKSSPTRGIIYNIHYFCTISEESEEDFDLLKMKLFIIL